MKSSKLLPQLGLFTTITIVVGAVIGSGIFKKPAVMAGYLGSPEILLGVWLLAGILTLFGALSNAEVAGLITETGGQYMFFDKMYGSLTSYLYGWAILSVIQTGSIASITYVFAEYTEYFFKLPRLPEAIESTYYLYMPFVGKIFPLKDIGVKSLTIFVIFLLSTVNYFGIKYGGRVAEFFTTTKVLAMLVLVVAGFMYGGGSVENFVLDNPDFTAGNIGIIGGIVAALSAAFWAFDGWNNVTYIAGEVKNPMKNIPVALIVGTLIIIAVYTLINLAYLYVLPVDVMAQSKLVAADVADVSLGGMGGALIAALVMISTFGTSNGTIMVSARVYFAMSGQGMFFKTYGKVSPRFNTPANALALQAVWSAALVLSGSFDDLTDMLIFVSWIFYALGAYGVIILRKKMPDAHRPYKVPFYPYIPLIFVAVASIYVVLTLYNDIVNYIDGKTEIINSTFGLLLVLCGLPLYFYFKRKSK